MHRYLRFVYDYISHTSNAIRKINQVILSMDTASFVFIMMVLNLVLAIKMYHLNLHIQASLETYTRSSYSSPK